MPPQEPFLGKLRRDAMTADDVLRGQQAGCEREGRKHARNCTWYFSSMVTLDPPGKPLEVKGYHLQFEKRTLDSLKHQLVRGQGDTQNWVYVVVESQLLPQSHTRSRI